eukprot:6201154-Pleurochrysis_carterae.AAC.4
MGHGTWGMLTAAGEKDGAVMEVYVGANLRTCMRADAQAASFAYAEHAGPHPQNYVDASAREASVAEIV